MTILFASCLLSCIASYICFNYTVCAVSEIHLALMLWNWNIFFVMRMHENISVYACAMRIRKRHASDRINLEHIHRQSSNQCLRPDEANATI